jgi:hypothetical protein
MKLELNQLAQEYVLDHIETEAWTWRDFFLYKELNTPRADKYDRAAE